jgi:hypothetical protein
MKISPFLCVAVACLAIGSATAQQPARTNLVGAVDSIDPAGGQLTMHTDDGKIVRITPHPNAKWLRLPPGEKNFANATPITAKEIAVGDRLLARGELSEDKAQLAASTLVIMTKADIAQKQQADRAEWQKRGVRGIVTAVDSNAGTVTITTRTAEGRKPLLIEVSKAASVRRYAPDSVKFADAKPSTLADIHPGDQVQALGAKSEDGSRYTAEELVSGAFRNVAAVVKEINPANQTLKVTDLETKKTLIVKVNGDSTLRKLPEMMARMIAARTSGGAPGGGQRPAGAPGGAPGRGAAGGGGQGWQGGQGGAPGGQGGAPRGGDMQAMLERLPALKLEDLKAGDAIIISSTEGATPDQVTAITLVAGVEPILTATAGGGQRAAMLGSWNLDMGGGMGGEQ